MQEVIVTHTYVHISLCDLVSIIVIFKYLYVRVCVCVCVCACVCVCVCVCVCIHGASLQEVLAVFSCVGC